MLKLAVFIFLIAIFLIGHNVVSSNEDDEQVTTQHDNAACKGHKTPTNARSQDSIQCSDQAVGVCTNKSEDWEVLEVAGCDLSKDPETHESTHYYFYC